MPQLGSIRDDERERLRSRFFRASRTPRLGTAWLWRGVQWCQAINRIEILKMFHAADTEEARASQ